MEKINVTKLFALRLREAMLAAGLHSSRSSSGVSIHELTEITGYSVQICRRYLRGEAIPEPAKLIEIAEKLGVTPGWLLFGDSHREAFGKTRDILISKELLHYFFTKIAFLYNDTQDVDDIADFLIELMTDISQMDAGEEQVKKIIDLALSSAKHFNH